jgi:adenosylmethionine-8-amino-7-oxononanoate aminotransferase
MVGEVRGVGLMLGVELVADRETKATFPEGTKPGLMIQAAGKRRGLLMRASPGFVALGPPLISTEADIDRMIEILDASIEEVQAELLPQ